MKAKAKKLSEVPKAAEIFLLPHVINSPPKHVKNSKEKRPTNFFDCVKPAYETSKKFGLMTFSIRYTANNEMEGTYVRSIDIVIFIISVLSYLVLGCLFVIFIIPISVLDFKTTVLLQSKQIFLTVSIFLCVISTIINMLNRHRLIEIVKMINTFDKEVNKNAKHTSRQFFLNIVIRLVSLQFMLIMKKTKNLWKDFKKSQH